MLLVDQGSGRGGALLQAGAAAAGRPQRRGHHVGSGLQGVSPTPAGERRAFTAQPARLGAAIDRNAT